MRRRLVVVALGIAVVLVGLLVVTHWSFRALPRHDGATTIIHSEQHWSSGWRTGWFRRGDAPCGFTQSYSRATASASTDWACLQAADGFKDIRVFVEDRHFHVVLGGARSSVSAVRFVYADGAQDTVQVVADGTLRGTWVLESARPTRVQRVEALDRAGAVVGAHACGDSSLNACLAL